MLLGMTPDTKQTSRKGSCVWSCHFLLGSAGVAQKVAPEQKVGTLHKKSIR